MSPLPSAGEQVKPTCREQCLEIRERTLGELRDCEHTAAAQSDQLAVIRHKRYCRERHVPPKCEGLSACPKKDSRIEAKPDSARLGAIDVRKLHVDPAVARAGQKILVVYEAAMNNPPHDELWFDQQVEIIDAKGSIALNDRQSFKKGTLSTVFTFKTEIPIPQKFAAGKLRLRVTLKERYSDWLGKAETRFEVR